MSPDDGECVHECCWFVCASRAWMQHPQLFRGINQHVRERTNLADNSNYTCMMSTTTPGNSNTKSCCGMQQG